MCKLENLSKTYIVRMKNSQITFIYLVSLIFEKLKTESFMISSNSNAKLLSRYSDKRGSALSVTKRSNSSTALQKIAYHTARVATLEPIKEATSSPEPKRSADDIIDEQGIPNTLMTVQQVKQKHHHDIQVPQLQPLPQNIDSSAFPLIEKKLELCSILPDFTDVDADKLAKNTKTMTLKELMNVFNSPVVVPILSPAIISKFFDMIKANLNRGLPAIPKKYLCFDDEPPLVDIAWPHLSLVYTVLQKFQEISPKNENFNDDFVNLLLNLLHAPDINERDKVVEIFIKYLDTYPDKEPYIFKRIGYFLIGYKEKVYDPFCVIPCLRIFLTRFKLNSPPITNNSSNNNNKPPPVVNEKHLAFFKQSILPLYSSQHIFSYYPLLTETFDFFIKQDISMCTFIFRTVVKGFPEARPSKQILFIQMLNFLVERTDPSDFEKIAVKLFTLYARCSQSCHYKVVDASFQIWGNVSIIPKILDNTSVIYPIVYANFNRTMKEHWSNRAQNAALNTLKSMHDTDPFMFDELNQNTQKKGNIMPEKDNAALQLHKNWAMVARTAAKVDRNVNLVRILADIQIKFNSNNNDMVAKKPPNRPIAKTNSNASPAPKIVSPGNTKSRFPNF
ncbi:phosphoprotein phosphatase [Tritrichomonas foetus]|uniref:Phosphoprotein phosphatase n=1 Tax=Tritrichomonas foetus TaxID=1144522 RepID=A0A1J4JW03_9EUKA|nr:phosphoprotein phosphatase [Tritrichomonas foetus]|eukprot:OHT03311.1 phosphoprotein phosphatase [Tritrichomonas foetus]